MKIEDVEKRAKQMEDEINQHKEKAFIEKMKKCQQMRIDHQTKQQDWLRFLVATSGTLFSVLVALGDKKEVILYARWVFSFGLASLGFGVLSLAIALYEPIFHQKKDLRLFAKALSKFSTEAPQKLQAYKTPKLFGYCENTGYIALALAVLFLVAYSLSIVLS